jgi:hypothetical protein
LVCGIGARFIRTKVLIRKASRKTCGQHVIGGVSTSTGNHDETESRGSGRRGLNRDGFDRALFALLLEYRRKQPISNIELIVRYDVKPIWCAKFNFSDVDAYHFREPDFQEGKFLVIHQLDG